MPSPDLSPREIQRMLELHAAGCADAEIARQLGRDVTRVRRWRVRQGLPRNCEPGWPTNPNPKRDDIIALRRRGLSYRRVAARLGITVGVVAGIVWREANSNA